MAKFIDDDEKYRVISIVVLCFFLFIIILAITLSNLDLKFNFKNEGPVAIVLNEGELVINYLEGNTISFNDSKEHEYNVTITNSSSEKIYYSLYFNSINTERISVTIKNSDGEVVNEMNKDFSTDKLLNLYSVEGNDTVRYSIVIKPKGIISFNASLKVDNESLTTQTFSDILLFNNSVEAPTTRVGLEISKSNEGLISGIDNKGTTYFFRGNVKNNYVKIGDMLFRVVRINGDGSVRLVLNDTLPDKVPYNSNPLSDGQDASSVALLDTTSLMNILNGWYNKYLNSYAKYLSKGDYCVDTNFYNQINGIMYTNTYDRIFVDNTADLFCNGKILSLNVGLLSVDEVTYAGAYRKNANTNYYLYNNSIKESYVTGSTYFKNSNNEIAMMTINPDGSIGDGVLVNTPVYIRPVINIGVSAKVKGDGTIHNPYIIVS